MEYTRQYFSNFGLRYIGPDLLREYDYNELINSENPVYLQLNSIIEHFNHIYELIIWNENQLSSNMTGKKEETDLLEYISKQKWYLIHIYATVLGDYILDHPTRIQQKDTLAFDMVPYLVWNKMKSTAISIILHIADRHKS